MSTGAIIITGAGQGIGRATALRLAGDGRDLVLNARTLADIDAVASAVEGAGGRAAPVVGDAADPDVIDRMVRRACNRFGGVAGLVTCAGLAPLLPITELDPETFDRVIALNVRGVYLASRAVWPHMVEGGGGVIVHISSMSSVDPFTGFGVYGGSKAFVNAFTKGLAAEGEAVGIRTYALAPGAVETGMLRGLFPDFPPEQCLLPVELADAVAGLIAGDSGHTSGETIFMTKQK